MKKVNYLVVTGIMAALITLMTAYICHIPVGTILDKTIHVTEYNYKCPSCGSIVEYDDQLEIEQVQKKMKSRTLSDMELVSEREWAQKRVSRNKKITFAISLSVSALFIISIILLANGV